MATDQETDIFERLQDICSKQLGVTKERIELDTNFSTDLEADSLDVVELVMSFEEEFDIPIDDEVAGEMQTVRNVVDFVTKTKSENS